MVLPSFNSSLVHDLIQQHVVEHFGYQHVNALRTALHRIPDDPVVQAAFYGERLNSSRSLEKLLASR